MLINFHLSSKESRAQSNLFFNSISSALLVDNLVDKLQAPRALRTNHRAQFWEL